MDILKFLRLLSIYVVLLGVDRVLPVGPMKYFINALALGIPLMMAANYLLSNRPVYVPTTIALAVGLFMLALAGSWAVNGIFDLADFVKFLLLPSFVLFGLNADKFDGASAGQVASLRRLAAVLLFVPLVLFVVNDRFPHPDPSFVSIFANRNNAGLYMACLANVLFLLNVRLGYIVGFLVILSLLFSTLGVLAAVVVALVFSLQVRRYAVLYIAAAVVGVGTIYAIPELPVVERIRTLSEGVELVSRAGLWAHLDEVSYRDLYLLVGSSDLSFFFRLKHWQELWVAYSSGSALQWLFGLGVGSSVFYTDLGLVPHNDYLRFLIETGLLGLTGFALLSIYLMIRIGRVPYVISTAVVTVYFLSENLVDNFSAMAMYYFFAGYWMRYGSEVAQAANAPVEEVSREPSVA